MKSALIAVLVVMVLISGVSVAFADTTNTNTNITSNTNNNSNTNTIRINTGTSDRYDRPYYRPEPQYYPPVYQPPVYYPQPQPVYYPTPTPAPAPVQPTVLGTQAIYYVAQPQYVQQPIYTTAYTAAATACALRIYNLGVDDDANQNVIVRFNTTCPAQGYVRYGLASEWGKTGNFSYPFGTQPGPFTTMHQVNLGKLAMNQTYFLRAFAQSGNQTVFSAEIAFVQLPTGVSVVGGNTNVTPTYPSTSASAYSTVGSIFMNPWFLLLLIIALVVAIVLTLRRRAVVSATGPIEINA